MLTSSKYIFYEYFIVLSNLSARNNLATGGGAAVQTLEYASLNLICTEAVKGLQTSNIDSELR
jgi:hypothetical protein